MVRGCTAHIYACKGHIKGRIGKIAAENDVVFGLCSVFLM